MKSSLARFTILACAATLAFAPAARLFAHAEAPAAKSGQGEHAEHAPGAAPTFATAMDALAATFRATGKLEIFVGANQLDGVHNQADALTTALKALPEKAGDLGADKKKRLESAVRQAVKLANNLHDAADGAEQMRAEAELKKLVAALRLVEAQFPADSVKLAREKAQHEG